MIWKNIYKLQNQTEMKNNTKSLVDAVINDNRQHIKEYNQEGSVYEYLYADFATDQGHCFYLTDEEIKLWESGEDNRSDLINEINGFLEGYKDVNLNDSRDKEWWQPEGYTEDQAIVLATSHIPYIHEVLGAEDEAKFNYSLFDQDIDLDVYAKWVAERENW